MTECIAADGPLRAEFFETVRQILLATGDGAAAPAIGGDQPPEREPVRFAAAQGSRHPDAEIMRASRDDDRGPVTIGVAFLGLTGPSGVLPDHYGELVVARDRARDTAFAAFLDLFNHRAASHFYRAWAKYRLTVAFAATRGSLRDDVSVALAALAVGGRPIDDPRVLGATGLLAKRVRTPEALRRTLALMFGLPVTIEELRARRLRIDEAEQTRIGSKRNGRFARLGVDAVSGATVADIAGRFRIRIGPLDRATFDAFLGDESLAEKVSGATRRTAGIAAAFDIQLVLAADAVPRARIGCGGDAARLGRSSWLLHGGSSHDRDDTILPTAASGRATAATQP